MLFIELHFFLQDTLEEVDKDHDGMISLDEYLS